MDSIMQIALPFIISKNLEVVQGDNQMQSIVNRETRG
jgi:hypothetical protein